MNASKTVRSLFPSQFCLSLLFVRVYYGSFGRARRNSFIFRFDFFIFF